MQAGHPRYQAAALPQLGRSPGSALLRLELGRNLTLGLAGLLGREIATGRYDREPFPTERALAERYAVSLSVAREAVKMLTAKGMLDARPRQGTLPQPLARWNLLDTDVLHWLIDRPFPTSLLRQFDELRIAVEPEAAALAASRPAAQGDRALLDSLARLRGEDDLPGAQIAFHVAVLQASANPFYQQFRELVATALRNSIRFASRREGWAVDRADYAMAGEAILARDPRAARTAMRRLITDIVAPGDAPAPGIGAPWSDDR